jgi:hypothetical protein
MTSSSAQDGNESCLPKTSGASKQIDIPEGGVDSGPDIFGDPQPDWVFRHNFDRIRELCSVGLSPRMLSGVIMRLLKNHFSDPALILTPNLRQYIYSDDALKSRIRIVKSANFDATTAGQYPALIVRRLPLQSQRHSMGDRTDTFGNIQDEQMRGIQRHSRFITGAHRIFCLAENEAESEDLAQEVFDLLSFLSPAVVGYLPFHDFAVTAMGDQGVLDDTPAIGVAVDVTYAYEFAWTLQALAPRLKTISLGLP